MDRVLEELEKIKASQTRYEEQYLNKNSGSAGSSLSGTLTNQEEMLRGMRKSIENLENLVADMNKQIYNNKCSIHDLEQYGRRNCLILHGCQNIPTNQASYFEFEKFVINKLNNKLKLTCKITPLDIDTCHTLPSRNRDTKPIIIKFVRRSVRDMVFSLKKNLKASNGDTEKLAISESLTKRRFSILSEAKKSFGFRNVWTWNGYIYCFFKQKRHAIYDLYDIDKLLN